MPGPTRRRPAAKLDELPTVLDTQQVANVLRCSRDVVRKLVAEGRLHRLDYSNHDFLFYCEELQRFLRQASTPESTSKPIGF
jgi:excisionase family DNA binding protein